MSMTDEQIKERAEAFHAKVDELKAAHPPGTDIWLYGQDAFCIHCVASISLKSAMVAGEVKPGTTEYIGGPDHYAQRLSPAEVTIYTAEMAEYGLRPCACEA